MKFIFKNTFRFSVLYIALYLLDTFFKNSDALYAFRYISKIILSLSLLLFYLFIASTLIVFEAPQRNTKISSTLLRWLSYSLFNNPFKIETIRYTSSKEVYNGTGAQRMTSGSRQSVITCCAVSFLCTFLSAFFT